MPGPIAAQCTIALGYFEQGFLGATVIALAFIGGVPGTSGAPLWGVRVLADNSSPTGLNRIGCSVVGKDRHMFSRSHASLKVFASVGVFAALALSGAAVSAQTNTGAVGVTPTTPTDQSCAVSTARIGGLDVTQFFGVSGGATSFGEHFGASLNQTSVSGSTQSIVQRCIRLEVENPSPGDLVPAGGYVLGGFALDPTAAAGQGTGITNIQVFLDDPNQGGSVIGGAGTGSGASATGFGLPSVRGAAFGDQFANSGFRMTVQIPSSAAGSPHAVFVVALANTGRVGSVAVPVVVGNLTPAVPTRTP
jgi:hypothetical protein